MKQQPDNGRSNTGSLVDNVIEADGAKSIAYPHGTHHEHVPVLVPDVYLCTIVLLIISVFMFDLLVHSSGQKLDTPRHEAMTESK